MIPARAAAAEIQALLSLSARRDAALETPEALTGRRMRRALDEFAMGKVLLEFVIRTSGASSTVNPNLHERIPMQLFLQRAARRLDPLAVIRGWFHEYTLGTFSA